MPGKSTIPAADALERIKRGEALRNTRVLGLLDGHCHTFEHQVLLLDSEMSANFLGCWFPRGFIAERCVFSGPLGLDQGIHNDSGVFALRDCVFNGPVVFDDAVFSGPVENTGCRFEQGTDLFDLPWGWQDQFRQSVYIENNHGDLKTPTEDV